ncbi:MAG: hypothetical protein Fur0035_03920 [Anaerolineales bacterium]
MRSLLLCFTLLLISACSPVPSAPTLTPVLTASAVPHQEETTTPAPSAPAQSSPLSSATPTQPPFPSSDRATFLGESYPDGSLLKPGETFLKTWDVKNLGSSAWTQDYRLVLMTNGETLASPAQIPFPTSVAPGETAHLSVTLTAPQTPGTYTVVWSLQNAQGQIFKVDGSDIWAKIQVCDSPTGCTAPLPAGQTVSGGSVSAALQSFTPSAESANASFCLTLPSRNWGPEEIALILDGRAVPFSTGGSLPQTGCFEFEFAVTQAEVDSARAISLSVGNVRLLGGGTNPQQRCEDAKPALLAQYPGLDFTCSYSMAGYYTNLRLPVGMNENQADQLITDAIEGAIYGPWVLTIR